MDAKTKLTMRPFRDDDDFWKMRAFLREIFPLNNRLEHSWSVPRLDYWRWHHIMTCEAPVMADVCFLWETPGGALAAVLHPLWHGEIFMHVHPHARDAALEHEMLAIAEAHLTTTNAAGQRQLVILANEDDPFRQDVFNARGYRRRERYARRWRRDLDAPLPIVHPAQGYTIRSMGGSEEYEARAWASWQAFHPDEPDDDFEGGDWYANLQSAPLYRHDLDIVAVAPNGEIAAFSTLWYDDATRSGVCVLVGTAPEHQRRGLGTAVINEGLRRAQQLGCTRVFANGYDGPANALYKAALGTHLKAGSWIKVFGDEHG